MKQYLELSQRIVNEGVWVNNERTGKKCLTVINADLEYNAGEFPLVTTRKSFWKSAISEMLGYIRGYNDAGDFRALGTKTWDANANDNKVWLDNPNRMGTDDMGRAYRFRVNGYSFLTNPNETKYDSTGDIPYSQDILECDYSKNSLGYVGSVNTSTDSGDYIAITEETVSDNTYIKIQFINTGYVTLILPSCYTDTDNTISDPYAPVIFDVACLGERQDVDLYDVLLETWTDIIRECSESPSQNVCDRWLIYSNFLEDFKKLYNWELKSVFPNEYNIDKGYSKSNTYAPDVCRWSTKTEQSTNSISTLNFLATKDGKTHMCKGLNQYIDELDIDAGIHLELRGKVSGDIIQYDGWDIELLSPDTLTYVEVDQFKTIYAKLKLGIDDRRLIMDAHNPHMNEYAALPACMFGHTFSLMGNTLYLTSNQRSCDVLLGLNFNMVQVHFLLAIMAQITSHEHGKAYHKIVNAHIYEDQLEIYKSTQALREPFNAPTFHINPDIKSLEDLETWVTTDDFWVEGYEHHEGIKYPFSV